MHRVQVQSNPVPIFQGRTLPTVSKWNCYTCLPFFYRFLRVQSTCFYCITCLLQPQVAYHKQYLWPRARRDTHKQLRALLTVGRVQSNAFVWPFAYCVLASHDLCLLTVSSTRAEEVRSNTCCLCSGSSTFFRPSNRSLHSKARSATSCFPLEIYKLCTD